MVSVFDIFKIGIGPSSSHTNGPMIAAGMFADHLIAAGHFDRTAHLTCELYGSLAFTGRGHATDMAIILGLAGERPSEIDPSTTEDKLARIAREKALMLAGRHPVRFDPAKDLVFDQKTPSPGHPNALRLKAFAGSGELLLQKVYFSVGGGFVVPQEEYDTPRSAVPDAGGIKVPFPFTKAAPLLDICAREKRSIASVVLANESALRPEAEVIAGLDRLWEAMKSCIDRGLAQDGVLPGRLQVRRRAKKLYENACASKTKNLVFPHHCLDYVSAFAIAVNEENAAGGRVVTSPTNGAAGVIPAVMRYYKDLCPGADRDGIHTFMLSATAFGGIIKYNASLSGAEVGCQGEVGSASAMAAAGLAAAMGGTAEQVENAAEIALEHHLGMTCDPVGGLVQVPCIERNAMGAVKAINAASLAMAGDGKHVVSFDTVVETMRQTGLDLQHKYKETSLGGLAVTVVEC